MTLFGAKKLKVFSFDVGAYGNAYESKKTTQFFHCIDWNSCLPHLLSLICIKWQIRQFNSALHAQIWLRFMNAKSNICEKPNDTHSLVSVYFQISIIDRPARQEPKLSRCILCISFFPTNFSSLTVFWQNLLKSHFNFFSLINFRAPRYSLYW